MSKKVNNEKEIEKARTDRKWQTVIDYAQALSAKTAGGYLKPEELELYVCFLLGEALLETCVDEKNALGKNLHIFSQDDLKESYSYLSAANTAVKKSKDKFPEIYQDAHLLLAKYHCMVEEYELCLQYVNSLEFLNFNSLLKRSKFIMVEALACKALSMDALSEESMPDEDVLKAYEFAGEFILSLCIEERGTLKKSTPAPSVFMFSSLLEKCLLSPADRYISKGKMDDAIHCYRNILRSSEVKATMNIRKIACRRLAELLLSCTSSLSYLPPSTTTGSEDRVASLSVSSPDTSLSLPLKPMKRMLSFNENSFSPKDEIEEAVLVLLLSEAMLCRNAIVSQRKEDLDKKKELLSETKIIFDLLVLVLLRRDQCNLITQCYESVMKLAFKEFYLWYQYALSLISSGKYKQALLTLEQCQTLQPENTDVLMFSVKLCINHSREYNAAIKYAEKVVGITSDTVVEASARLAIGICYTYLACKASTTSETQSMLKNALESLNLAVKLDPNDADIQFNLAFCQALTKQLPVALSTIKSSLVMNNDHLASLHLLVLLLSAQKKYHEALEVLESAIEEYPEEFSLLLTKLKLTEKCYGPQVSLVVCREILSLWSELCNAKDNEDDLDKFEVEKSPSFSHSTKSFNLESTPSIKSAKQTLGEPKHHDSASVKKMAISESQSLYDEDGTGSITASIRLERTLSEDASGSIAGNTQMGYSTSLALLCKLWLVTAECFINIEDLTEAYGCILEASSIFPLSPDVLYMRGRYNESKENLQEAKACYESALSVLPSHKAAAQRLGLLHLDERNLVLAEKLLRSCILQDSSDHTAWNDLGLVLEADGRCEEASDCFFTSLQLEATSPVVPYTSIPRLFSASDHC